MKTTAIIDLIWGKQPGNSPGGLVAGKIMQVIHESASRFTLARVMAIRENDAALEVGTICSGNSGN